MELPPPSPGNVPDDLSRFQKPHKNYIKCDDKLNTCLIEEFLRYFIVSIQERCNLNTAMQIIISWHLKDDFQRNKYVL